MSLTLFLRGPAGGRVVLLTVFLSIAAVLVGCGPPESEFPGKGGQRDPSGEAENAPGLFGEDGIELFGGDEEQSGGGIGVNGFLWRASLDTLAFMPLSSADPFGGVIITDWYADPESPNERFKMTVYILDRRLRADGIRVSVFRQQRDPTGGWVDSPINPQTAVQLENAILTRARQLRIDTMDVES